MNQIAYGEIFVDATVQDIVLENAQLSCETYALENGLDEEICDTPTSIEGARDACISFVTTFESKDYRRFIGVSSGDNHIRIRKEAAENCVAAVESAGSGQTCDGYERTRCNDFGELHDPANSIHLSRIYQTLIQNLSAPGFLNN